MSGREVLLRKRRIEGEGERVGLEGEEGRDRGRGGGGVDGEEGGGRGRGGAGVEGEEGGGRGRGGQG